MTPYLNPAASNQINLNKLRPGNFVFIDSGTDITVNVFDRSGAKIYSLGFSGVSDPQRSAMFQAIMNLNSKTRELTPPQLPLAKEFLGVVISTLANGQFLVDGKSLSSSQEIISELCSAYDRKLSSSLIRREASPLRVVELGSSQKQAKLAPVSLGSLSQSLRQLNLVDKPIWVDFDTAVHSNNSMDGLLRIANALGIDANNIAVVLAETPSIVSRRKDDSWWHFCSLGVETAEVGLSDKELLRTTTLHTFIKGQAILTVHEGKHYAIERVMTDMLQGGFCANGDQSNNGRSVGTGHLFSVILASVTHRASDIVRGTVETAVNELNGQTVLGSTKQQILAVRIGQAVGVLQRFWNSLEIDIRELETAATLGDQYGVNPTYLSKLPALATNIERSFNSINGAVERFHSNWQTAIDLVNSRQGLNLTRLFGILGAPAAATTLLDLQINTPKGVAAAVLTAVVTLIMLSRKPKHAGKRIQLG